MPDTPEPSNPPRRKRHVLRWIVLGMALIIIAGAIILYKWGDNDSMPGFLQTFEWRCRIFVSKAFYGRDSPQTRHAREVLSWKLLADDSYRAAANAWQAFVASEERARGTNDPFLDRFRMLEAECLFLQGKKEEAVPFIHRALKGVSRDGVGTFLLISDLFSRGRRDEALALNQFEWEQAQIVFKEDGVNLERWKQKYESDWYVLTNVYNLNNLPPSNPRAK